MAMNDEVKLFGIWASPFSRRIEMALKFKGVPYEYFDEDLNNKSPMLLQLNPIHKKVPVLVHNGKVIIESHVVLEYIEETWPHNPILPQDPYLRSNARFFARLVDDQISNSGFASMVKAGEAGRESLIEQSRDLIKHLETELAGKDFFGGKTVGFLDFIAGSLIPFCLERYWEGIGIDVTPEDKFPEFNKWVKKMEEVEAVKECIPPKKEHIEHMMYMAERIKSA